MVSLGTDIKVDLNFGDLVFGVSNDFEFIEETDNLNQAIYLRLLTPKGHFIKHPEYGSELYTLQGEPHDDETLSKAVLYTYDALSYEPRIQDIVDIQANWVQQDNKEILQLDITYIPIEQDVAYNVIVSYEV